MFLIISLLTVLAVLFSFGVVTSAISTGGNYQSIPQAVRDYYSKEVLFQAQPRCKFLQFAKIKRDLTAIRGKSIVFTKYNNLVGGGAIAENATLNPEAMAASNITIPVTEQVNAVEITEMLARTALTDILEDSSKSLANNLAVVLDKQFRDAALSTTNIKYGNGAATAAAMTAASIFNAKTVKDAVETLAINNAPKFDGEYYVCIAHPSQLRQLRDDSAWINANTYNGRRQLYKGEVGMYEGVIFIETTNMPRLTNAQVVAKYGTYTPTFGCEAVIFGENAYAWAIALDVEFREDGVKELGRKRTIGWYGIWGTGLVEEGNCVRVLTAAA